MLLLTESVGLFIWLNSTGNVIFGMFGYNSVHNHLQVIQTSTQQLDWNPCVSFFSVRCERGDERKTQGVRAGESLYLPCPNLSCFEETVNSSYVWFRNLSTTRQVERIGTEESERVHYHQSVLYILWLNLNDTGRYITRWWSHTSIQLSMHIHVVPNLSDSHLLNTEGIISKMQLSMHQKCK